MKPTKIPPKSKKSSIFWLSFGVFWSFLEVSRVFFLFWEFSGILAILKVSGNVVVILGAFWSFSRVLGYFEHLWCVLVILAALRGPF